MGNALQFIYLVFFHFLYQIKRNQRNCLMIAYDCDDMLFDLGAFFLDKSWTVDMLNILQLHRMINFFFSPPLLFSS